MAESLAVNKHETLLLVGKAATNFAVGEIVYSEDYEGILEKYGDSDISRAFLQAQKIGARYIYLLNLQKDQDYFDAIGALKESDFAYVAFVSLFLSDTFQDMYGENLVHSTIAFILGSIGRDCNTTFIITDKHASLYEDIDAYLSDMRAVQTRFLGHCSTRANLQNVIFTANNLKDYRASSVAVGAALASSPINTYPASNFFGGTIFFINAWDDPGDMAYFRQNITRETTIENLVNMSVEHIPEKVVFIDRIVKYIKRDLEFREFKGRPYTSYQKLLFSQKLKSYYEKIKGFILRAYSIDSVEAYSAAPGTVTLLSRISVMPISSLETCTIKSEVEL